MKKWNDKISARVQETKSRALFAIRALYLYSNNAIISLDITH